VLFMVPKGDNECHDYHHVFVIFFHFHCVKAVRPRLSSHINARDPIGRPDNPERRYTTALGGRGKIMWSRG
jgi:hypothetical protein